MEREDNEWVRVIEKVAEVSTRASASRKSKRGCRLKCRTSGKSSGTSTATTFVPRSRALRVRGSAWKGHIGGGGARPGSAQGRASAAQDGHEKARSPQQG